MRHANGIQGGAGLQLNPALGKFFTNDLHRFLFREENGRHDHLASGRPAAFAVLEDRSDDDPAGLAIGIDALEPRKVDNGKGRGPGQDLAPGRILGGAMRSTGFVFIVELGWL